VELYLYLLNMPSWFAQGLYLFNNNNNNNNIAVNFFFGFIDVSHNGMLILSEMEIYENVVWIGLTRNRFHWLSLVDIDGTSGSVKC
jgi:hypothetical protein